MQYIVLFLLLSAGGFLILTAVMRLPPRQTSKNLQKMYIHKLSLGKRLEQAILTPLIKPVSKLIRLSERVDVLLGADLQRAGIPYTPREYYARAIIFAALSLVFPFLVPVAGIPILIPVSAVLPVLLFRKFSIEHKDILKKKRQQIGMVLPPFIRFVLYRLSGSEDGRVQIDVVAIFEDYIKIAPDALEYDVRLLVTEMKSKGVTQGLHSFDRRLNLPEVGFLVRALIGIHQGQPQQGALAALSRDTDVRARENLKRELDRQPGKIKRATLPLVLVGVAALLYVLVYSLMNNASGMF
jgi:hypothetical protein